MTRTKILLVDDELDFLNVITARIESWGYEVMAASSGKQAINMLARKNPDIIVLDYMMPEMDGITTLEEIRKINANVSVIMFTAYPDGRSYSGADKFGVSAFLPKLSSHFDLQASLKDALKSAERSLKKRWM